MAQIVDLSDVGSAMINAVGGKALHLGIMISAGLPVPGGFCVTTVAYRAVVQGRLDDLMDKLAAATDPNAVAAAAEEARRRVLALEVPAELRTAISDHYNALGDDVPVAVRSSATAEDLAHASFAGQQDTFLNVVGAAALIDAVRRCWASLWTDRAVSYRNANGIDHSSVALAVVVQHMIDAAAAGVMFTANPITGSRNETVIDAASGLGEAVVSGAVNPDHFVVNSVDRRIVARRLGDNRMMITSRPGGGTEHRELTDRSPEGCLDDQQVLQLVDLGQQVQRHYAAPQDTEWALDAGGRFWLTQARPITTLYPLPRTHKPGLRVPMCLSLAQGLTRPITPMGIAAVRLIGTSVATMLRMRPTQPLAGPPALHAPGQRIYLDITPVLRNRIGRRAVIAIFGIMEARTSAVLRTLGEWPEFSFIDSSDHTVLRHIAGASLHNKVPVRIAIGLVKPEWAYRGIAATERRLRRTLTVPANATASQRLDFVEQQLGELFLVMPRMLGYALGGALMLLASHRLVRDVAEPGELQEVLRALPHNVTTEMDLKLWELTLQIREDEPSRMVFSNLVVPDLLQRYRERALPPVAQRGLQAFLRRYGHRAVAEIDLGMPRWSDDPSHLLGVISNYLQLDESDLDPVAQFKSGEAKAESMISSLTARVAQRSLIRARLAGWTLRRVRQLLGLRESPKFLLIVALSAMREHLKAVGRALAETKTIDQADDVFFLDLSEARRALAAGEDMRALVAERREAYEQELKRRHIPRLVLSDGTEPEAVAAQAARADGALAGSPASAGTVTGRARVVLDPVGARLEPGEILVAPSTDPGWTPLFLTAGGLVMEMGGSNSHGAVVAREYGIPAVVGVPDATHKIETGQLITVDGAAGLISIAA